VKIRLPILVILMSFLDWQLLASKEKLVQSYQLSSYAYTGYAWSKSSNVTNPDPTIFATVSSNDTDHGGLSNSPFSGVSLQYNFCDWCSCGFSYEMYALWSYQRYHINGNPQQELSSGDYLRQFLMNHQAAQIEGYLKLPRRYQLVIKNFLNVTPLIGAGMGVGISNLFNFGTIAKKGSSSSEINYVTVGSDYINKSFAWHLEAGLKFSSLDSNFSFGLAYRYYDGGNFTSGTRYQINGETGIASLDSVLILPGWSGNVVANELKLYVEFDFN